MIIRSQVGHLANETRAEFLVNLGQEFTHEYFHQTHYLQFVVSLGEARPHFTKKPLHCFKIRSMALTYKKQVNRFPPWDTGIDGRNKPFINGRHGKNMRLGWQLRVKELKIVYG